MLLPKIIVTVPVHVYSLRQQKRQTLAITTTCRRNCATDSKATIHLPIGRTCCSHMFVACCSPHNVLYTVILQTPAPSASCSNCFLDICILHFIPRNMLEASVSASLLEPAVQTKNPFLSRNPLYNFLRPCSRNHRPPFSTDTSFKRLSCHINHHHHCTTIYYSTVLYCTSHAQSTVHTQQRTSVYSVQYFLHITIFCIRITSITEYPF